MGANNSILFEKPERRASIDISPSVVTRLENALKQIGKKLDGEILEKDSSKNWGTPLLQQPQQQKDQQEQEQRTRQHQHQEQRYQHPYKHSQHYKRHHDNWTTIPSDVLLDRAFVQLEDNHFKKAKEKIENQFDKPVRWTANIDGEIQMLRNKLIACHRENPGESLCCAELAAKYQDLIFREQFAAILKLNRKTEEDERESQQQDQEEEPECFSQRDRV